MRYIFAVFAAVCLSVLIAACGASVGPTPVGNTAGAPAQTQSTQTYSVTTTNSFSLAAPAFGGNQANIQFPAATGGPKNASMTVSASMTEPGSLPPLSKARLPASLRNIKDFTYTAQWFYDVIASASLTFPMAPAWSVTVATSDFGSELLYRVLRSDGSRLEHLRWRNAAKPPDRPRRTSSILFTPAAIASPMVIPTRLTGRELRTSRDYGNDADAGSDTDADRRHVTRTDRQIQTLRTKALRVRGRSNSSDRLDTVLRSGSNAVSGRDVGAGADDHDRNARRHGIAI